MHYTVAMKNTFILQIEAFPSDVIGHLFSHLIFNEFFILSQGSNVICWELS